MTVTAESFRDDYPEFTSSTLYPPDAIAYWLNIATIMLQPARWADVLDLGTALFMAHHLTLERQAQNSAANGGLPGISSGPIASKGVDRVSVSYDTAAGIEPEAGHWNLTVFGTRFIRLARMAGAGGIQLY